MEPVLQISRLNIAFHTKEGLVHAAGDINLSIGEGEIWGLAGETGCGKSVLGQAVLRLLPDNVRMSGEILYRSKNLLSVSQKELCRIRGKQIAYICQNPGMALNPLLKNGTQLMESVSMNQNRPPFRRRYEIAKGLLADMGFPYPELCMERYPFQLSGGMKQRVLAAMGMSGTPGLLIADEPTKGLDALIRGQVIDTVRKFIEKTGCAALIITHDLKFAAALCTHMAVMYGGELVETGRSEDVCAHPRHPYMKALLEAQPDRGMKPIRGESCSLVDLPEGCRFYGRCEKAAEGCGGIHPAMRKAGAYGEVRCIYA